MEWIGAKVDWIKQIKFFAHPYLNIGYMFLLVLTTS